MRRTRIVPRGARWVLQERVWWGWRRVVADERRGRLRELVHLANRARLKDGRAARWWLPS